MILHQSRVVLVIFNPTTPGKNILQPFNHQPLGGTQRARKRAALHPAPLDPPPPARPLPPNLARYPARNVIIINVKLLRLHHSQSWLVTSSLTTPSKNILQPFKRQPLGGTQRARKRAVLHSVAPPARATLPPTPAPPRGATPPPPPPIPPPPPPAPPPLRDAGRSWSSGCRRGAGSGWRGGGARRTEGCSAQTPESAPRRVILHAQPYPPGCTFRSTFFENALLSGPGGRSSFCRVR